MSQELVERLKSNITALVRQLMAEVLVRDAELQEKGDVDQIGQDSDEIDGIRFGSADRETSIAWSFWEAWQDDRNHSFIGYYEGFKKDDWPRYVRYIADQLASGGEITDPLILSHFDHRIRSHERTSLLAAIKRLFRRS